MQKLVKQFIEDNFQKNVDFKKTDYVFHLAKANQ